MLEQILEIIAMLLKWYAELVRAGFLSPEDFAAIIEQLLNGSWMTRFNLLLSEVTYDYNGFIVGFHELISLMDKSGGKILLDLNPPPSPPPSPPPLDIPELPSIIPELPPSPPNSPPPWLNPSPPATPPPPLDQGETELLQLYILVGITIFVGEYMRQLWIKETRIAKEEEEKKLKEQQEKDNNSSDSGNDIGE